MKIRPRNIPKFQNGGETFNLSQWIEQNPEYFKWYSDIYPNAQTFLGSPLKQRNDLWNQKQLSSSHYTTDDLKRSAYNNYLYTNDYQARGEDLQHWGELQNDFSSISDQDFVNRYNNQAQQIRDAREAPQTYNTKGYTGTNRIFRNMFMNRSKQGTNVPLYTIGYQDNIEDIIGTSTWQRRMDRYEKPFLEDAPEGQQNRIFYITKPDGTKIKVYKKQNGDIGLFSEIENQINPPENVGKIPIETNDQYGFDWKSLSQNLQKALPGLISTGRLLGTLNANNKIFKESIAGIRPALQQTYLTHRQVVGDEATKQAYYRRAAQGQTKAAQPFTSDADRQVAYQMEAKRVGDEMRAQGDLADNAEIRRTSDESNQHQWQNVARRTDVANRNTLAINDANSNIQRLKAQREASRWTSIENYLKGIENNLKQKDAVNQQLAALQAQYNMQNDEELQNLYIKRSEALNEALKKYNNDYIKARADVNFRNADKAYKKRQLEVNSQYIIDTNKSNIFWAKKGSKITLKQNDSLLYKTARDAVKHYEKMVALTDLSAARAKERKIKLISHPKGNTRRYQQGGVAPFVIYTPLGVGGERSISYQDQGNNAQAASKQKQTTTLDVIKDLFKNVDGIQIDVNMVYNGMYDLLQRQNILGEEFSENELASIYLQQLQQLNNIKRSKELKDWAQKEVTSNGAIGEFAITADGKYIVQKDGKLLEASLEDIKNDKNLNPLKNSDLLFLREYSPDMLLQKGDLYMNVVANGIGMDKIGDKIKSLLPDIKNNEKVLEGYTRHETNQIRQGLELLQEAPSGDYKYTITTKEQKEQANAAFHYIYSMLPRNMKAVLDINAYNNRTSVNDILASLITSSTGYTSKMGFDAVTGKAAKDANGNSKEGSKITPAIALAMGLGDRQDFIISDKTSDGLKISSVSLPLLDASYNPLAAATLQQVGSGAYSGQLDLGQVTMGGVKISANGINNVLIDRGRIYSSELPIDKQALANTGVIKPDLNFLKNIEKADEEIKKLGITDRSNLTPAQIQQINNIYQKNRLPIIYNVDGNGKPILTSDYRRFAMLHGSATENAFEEDLNFNNGVVKASKDERNRFESMMKDVTKNDKYKLDDPTSALGVNLWGGTDLYKGIIYIPMSNSTISALASTKYKASPQEYNQIEAADQQAEFIRSKGLKIQGSITK